jgi:hypothetical protein
MNGAQGSAGRIWSICRRWADDAASNGSRGTRNAKATRYAVIVGFGGTHCRYERRGLLVEPTALADQSADDLVLILRLVEYRRNFNHIRVRSFVQRTRHDECVRIGWWGANDYRRSREVSYPAGEFGGSQIS